MKSTIVMHNILSNPPEERRLEYQAEYALREILRSVSFVGDIDITHQRLEQAFDFMVVAEIAGRKRKLVVETSRNGQPRTARIALMRWTLSRLKESLKDNYFVFAAPYVSVASRDILIQAGAGYFDLLGNCHLAFDHIFIERFGHETKAQNRELRSIFHEKSSRVVRRLLTYPSHGWQVQELANDAGVSTGLVSQVKTKLLDSEIAERRGETFFLSRPEELLKQWGESYRFKRNELVEFYSSKPGPELESMLADYCDSHNIDYAFTLFAGTRLIGSQYVRVANRSHAYVLADPQSIGQELGLKPVESGGNFVLMKPFDEDLLLSKKRLEHSWVVSDIQLFLDFSAQKGREKETAEFLLDSRIRQNWESLDNAADS